MIRIIHYNWEENKVLKQVKCVHADAKKYKVNKMLTKGNVYDVINETDEFLFVVDNSKRVAGFYKEYFKEID